MSKKVTPSESIIVRGARTHNLKNITVEIPRNSMTAITGMSGSGKSSLAFDTIFAEGQRRYVESLSAYARQFLSQMPKPDVDEIVGLSPAISIDQKSRSNNPRSTVATITEVYDYLRVLFARIGRPYSPISGNEIKKLTNDEIITLIWNTVDTVTSQKKGKRAVLGVEWSEVNISILAPLVRGRKGEYYQLLYDLLGKGYSFVEVDGVVHNLREKIILDKNKPHTISLLIDTITAHEFSDNPADTRLRLSESIERALAEAEGLVHVRVANDQEPLYDQVLSAKFICPVDGFSFPEIEPRLFSFNSPYGACETCKGLGVKHLFGDDRDDVCEVCLGARLRTEANMVLIGSPAQARELANKIPETRTSIPQDYRETVTKKGKTTHTTHADKTGWERQGVNLFEFVQLSITDAHNLIMSLELTPKEEEIAGVLLNEIESRLKFLLDVGLEYLSLNRRANTLSGGEAQRIRLASQLGSKLVGALYVLDEPTIGLHQRDNDRLIDTLIQLRDLGNTIIVVEHDEDTVRAGDYIVDIGPGAGIHGGNVVVQGYLDPLLRAPTNASNSVTLAYLRGEEEIPVPEKRRSQDKGWIYVKGATLHNIHNLDVKIPLGRLVGITGVSGSGKSTFMYDILHRNLLARYDRKLRTSKAYHCAEFVGDNSLTRVVLVDQSPVGRSPRSNPATYTGAWTHIRDLFAATDEARLRGWGPSRFSFNVKGGRCEACEGRGEIAVEMHFLPTVYVQCDVCGGKRFDKETLGVLYKKKNVYQILQMTIEEAAVFFAEIPAVLDRLQCLLDVGLGYITLGQSSTELSGGESQRVKIASELYRPLTEKTIYLLDEPTVGLHFADVKKLVGILNRLVDKGNSVVVIEHDLGVIKSADYLIDFGPEGGTGGGTLVAFGTPEDVSNNPRSHTGKYLAPILSKKSAKTKKSSK
jgi:excinuclease ABC subunit A